MYLHIGEGLLVKKSEVIAILDARQIMDAENSQVFFDTFSGDHSLHENNIKSFVMVDAPKGQTKSNRRRLQKKEQKRDHQKSKPLILVSAIASTTLQKRFHSKNEEMMDIELRETHGKQTKQL
ncbi:hypothetical protein [Anoxynatronum sibiricum]|uniref:DUF370 domain-containing protein n=1 Tax=Anoxynatronum sibiricum TaxID=210623 RepID=A0ABU9VVF1_9CLOT